MPEQYRALPIENAFTSLAIPSEAMPLKEMVEVFIREEEVLKPAKQPLNRVFREARCAKGLTLKQLGEMSGIGKQTVGLFETLKQFPSDDQAAAIAQVLGADEHQLFPPYLQILVRSKQKPLEDSPKIIPLDQASEDEIVQMITREVGRTDFFNRDAAEVAMETFLKNAIESALDSLRHRQRRVIELRFGLNYEREHTFKEIGDEFDRTPEWARQETNRALRRFLKPHIAKPLYEYYVKENEHVHEAKEALVNGVINAIHQKDYERAKDNIAKIMNQALGFWGGLSLREKDILAEVGHNKRSSYRWSDKEMIRYIRWINRGYSSIDEDRLMRVVREVREVWTLKAQIPAND